MAATVSMASNLEENIRTLVQTKGIRINEFFHDFDKLRSGYITAPQFFRCLWQTLSLKLNEEEERELCRKYGISPDGRINYKQFCHAIDVNFDPQNVYMPPESQKNEPLEYLGTLRTKRPLPVDSESRLVEILRRLQQYCKIRSINLKYQYEDFDKHHKGVITESQFYRNFPGPVDTSDEDMKVLVEKYTDPSQPGFINYLNLHNDILAVHRFVAKEKEPETALKERNTDFVPLFPSHEPALSEIFQKISIAVFKHGIRMVDFFKDHDKLRSGVITESQFICGLSLACGKEAQIQRPEIQKVVEYYRLPDGRVQYKEFCDAMENAFNIPHLEKKPTESAQRPGKGTLFRGLKPLNEKEEERIKKVLDTIADKVSKERIMVYQYFKDFDRSKAYTRVVTPSQFCRILHFLGLNINNEDLRLVLNKFQDPTTGDVNYPAFVQAVDKEFVGHTMDDVDNLETDVTKVKAKTENDTKQVESSPVLFEELMARIRHIVLVNRLRVIEYFQDYDALRSGSISIGQFRRGLALMGLSKIGHHDLNDTQFGMLVEHYRNPQKPDQILWTKFHDDIESVFTQERLEHTPTAVVPRQELFCVPNPGTIDWSNASKEHMDLYNATMDRMRHRVKNRRILCKPVFQDFDRHNIGHITCSQFQQCFKILEIPVNEQELHALEALYSNDMGINYLKFLADLEPSEPIQLMYIKRIEELRKVNAKKTLPEQKPVTDLDSVLLKIKTKVCKERIRIYEFMKDYDKLRSGRMLKNLFRRALSLARLDLQESEIAILEDRYQSGFDVDCVEYLNFCKEIESIFTKDNLEKFPQEEVTQFKPNEEWTISQLSEQDEDCVRKCMLCIAEKVYKERIQLFPMFEDYDSVHTGAVSKSQFRRVMSTLGFANVASDTEFELLGKKFQAQVGGRTDVNYIALCKSIYDLAGFENSKP
ncbi:unnamed protein product [Candidula unifasciata]|uniref:EF-hand calcium-binding domain-containing protein 6 n=1 Tax=Candidula unifasciata TaxID=100452 RepID=A0A8S3Z6D4_9EUPU|nr:unnamed protein product [Candidula unifasciata]